MTNVIIVGAGGRMGREIIRLIPEDSELLLVGAVDRSGADCIDRDAGIYAGVAAMNVKITNDLLTVIDLADVIVDFSSPESIASYLGIAAESNTGIVVGTTGLSELDRKRFEDHAREGARIVYASNMSVGINLLFIICERVAKILGEEYDIEIIEMHHGKKKDAPSGTAETLGKILASSRGLDVKRHLRYGRKGLIGERPKNEIGIHSLRGGDVVGEHKVVFASNGERIELVHKASSRSTFARGALRAAKYIVDAEPGLYDMRQVLGLN